MKGDKIKCLNCNKIFKDTTELKIQDSRNGLFKNMCPYCYGTNTKNLVKCKKVSLPKAEIKRREKNRCIDCNADISHRGNRAIRCEKCQKIKRTDDKIIDKRKNRLKAELGITVKAYLDKLFKMTEFELLELLTSGEDNNTDDYKRLANFVMQKKFHPKASKYDLLRYSSEDFEHEILGILKIEIIT